ncbi:MAG: hypothetical protein ACI3XI_01980 [Eubacteriales bacterium]
MDDNIRFENVYTRTPEIYGEYYDAYQKTAFAHSRTVKKVCNVFVAACLVIIFGCMAILWQMEGSEEVARIALWLFVLAVLFVLMRIYSVFMKRQTVKRGIAREKELNGGELAEICTVVTESSLCLCLKGKDAWEVSLDKIKFMTQSENLILLVTEARLVFVIKKDSFVQGSARELWDFLKAKGIEIRK